MVAWLSLNGAFLLIAYLLGSMPTGYTVAKWLLGVDIRTVGSGSTGATNILRTLGKGPALGVLLVDVLKGVSAIALVRWVYTLGFTTTLVAPPILENWLPWMVVLAGLFAVLGHSKSIFLGFTGGKSVATGLGVLLGLSWPVGLGTLGVFAVVLAISRIVSLSSICGAMGVFGLMFILGQPLPYQLFGILAGLFVIGRHRSNIERLLKGTEPRIGQSLSPKVDTNTEVTS